MARYQVPREEISVSSTKISKQVYFAKTVLRGFYGTRFYVKVRPQPHKGPTHSPR